MTDQNRKSLCIYVDVDDTFVRSAGTKRIPMTSVIRTLRRLKGQGAILYCWSSGGAEYARASAEEFKIVDCFEAFLPKLHKLIDDQPLDEWRNFECIHPSSCDSLLEENSPLR